MLLSLLSSRASLKPLFLLFGILLAMAHVPTAVFWEDRFHQVALLKTIVSLLKVIPLTIPLRASTISSQLFWSWESSWIFLQLLFSKG